MDLKLIRTDLCAQGVFGILSSFDGSCKVASTLEHAYVGSNEPVSYIPKLPPGEYTCMRGMHQLAGMKAPFETFEVMSVPGHQGILLHVGNFNEDSSGCILLGKDRAGGMITQSTLTFEAFMKLQAGVNTFKLVVT